MALALGGVGAVGEEDGDERHDEQRQRARVVDDDHGAGEAEARVRRGDREVHQQHAAERLGAEPALGQRDRGADQQHGDERRRLAWRSARRSTTAGPKPSTVAASSWKTITARQVVSVNCAMLKTTLIAGRRRSMSSTTIGPTSPATTRSIGVANSRPKTSGRSPSENECALRRKCRWTTQRSAARKPERQPPPRDVHAERRTRGGPGPAPRAGATEAVTIATFSDQTPRSADSRRRAPLPGTWVAHRLREPRPEALDRCATGKGADGVLTGCDSAAKGASFRSTEMLDLPARLGLGALGGSGGGAAGSRRRA